MIFVVHKVLYHWICRNQSNINLYRGSTSCLCVHGFVCVKRMALASGHWLEKEMRGAAPSPRWVMFSRCNKQMVHAVIQQCRVCIRCVFVSLVTCC